jgi:hypothetical protein
MMIEVLAPADALQDSRRLVLLVVVEMTEWKRPECDGWGGSQRRSSAWRLDRRSKITSSTSGPLAAAKAPWHAQQPGRDHG